MANAVNATQKLVYAAMGCDTVTGGTLADIEWDSLGAVPASRQVVFNFGTLGAAGITELSVHASDTSGFTPAAGNALFDFDSATEPADGDDNTVWVVQIPENAGRYIQVVVTAGANACDISVLGLGIADEGPVSDSDRGVADFQFGAVA